MAGERRTAQEVFDDHLDQADRGRVDDDLRRNYADDVVFLTARGVERGHDAARRLADLLMQDLPGARFEYRTRLVEGDVAYLEWTARADDGSRVDDGADSFVIRDGRVVAQTIHYTVTRPGLG